MEFQESEARSEAYKDSLSNKAQADNETLYCKRKENRMLTKEQKEILASITDEIEYAKAYFRFNYQNKKNEEAREITSETYKRACKRTERNVASWLGNR